VLTVRDALEVSAEMYKKDANNVLDYIQRHLISLSIWEELRYVLQVIIVIVFIHHPYHLFLLQKVGVTILIKTLYLQSLLHNILFPFVTLYSELQADKHCANSLIPYQLNSVLILY
jgi:hypothetical protein